MGAVWCRYEAEQKGEIVQTAGKYLESFYEVCRGDSWMPCQNLTSPSF